MGGSFKPDQDIPDLDGEAIIVTGGNSGLGLETVRQLGKHRPARIYLAARSQDKAEAAIKQLRESNLEICPIVFLKLDLSSFSSVKAAAQTFASAESRLDILVNNAGIMMTAEGLTEDGYEIQFGTNVMGPVLFTQLLIPILQRTAKLNPQTRVVNVSSASERVVPSDVYQLAELKTDMSNRHTTARYCTSKLANIHCTSALAERYEDVKFVSVHPGTVRTNLANNTTGFFLRAFIYASSPFSSSAETGALAQIWAAVSPDVKSGEYYAPVAVPSSRSKASRDRELGEKLWGWIEEELKGHL
jgi:NAD(P)-dependent dehydrogenase (short-subunit alcohol dehydrogenase family)